MRGRARWAIIMAGVSLTAAAASISLLTAGPSAANPVSASSHGTPVARAIVAPRPIKPRRGKPFIPVLGDWEGSADGQPASFELSYGASVHPSSGMPSYTVGPIVAFLPSTCPAVPSYHAEALLDGVGPNDVRPSGGLGLAPFGYGGTFTGKRGATVSHGYRVNACRGRLSWHMHPSSRLAVVAGGWKLRYADGQTESFSVRAGGRLALAIPLPRALTRCNGARGAVDLFIEPNGKAAISQALVRLRMRFSRQSASGQLNAGGRGCAGGPIHFKASATSA